MSYQINTLDQQDRTENLFSFERFICCAHWIPHGAIYSPGDILTKQKAVGPAPPSLEEHQDCSHGVPDTHSPVTSCIHKKERSTDVNFRYDEHHRCCANGRPCQDTTGNQCSHSLDCPGLQQCEPRNPKGRPHKHLCRWPGCYKAYERPAGLKEHIETHHLLSRYACPYCLTTYTRFDELEKTHWNTEWDNHHRERCNARSHEQCQKERLLNPRVLVSSDKAGKDARASMKDVSLAPAVEARWIYPYSQTPQTFMQSQPLLPPGTCMDPAFQSIPALTSDQLHLAAYAQSLPNKGNDLSSSVPSDAGFELDRNTHYCPAPSTIATHLPDEGFKDQDMDSNKAVEDNDAYPRQPDVLDEFMAMDMRTINPERDFLPHGQLGSSDHSICQTRFQPWNDFMREPTPTDNNFKFDEARNLMSAERL